MNTSNDGSLAMEGFHLITAWSLMGEITSIDDGESNSTFALNATS
ncbi:hypothetical protein O9992_30730 [Vibrio lentus]|nr:hypothetical protein [Vibrio lentus]